MYDYTKNVVSDYTKNLMWSRLRVGILVSAAIFIIFLVVIFASNIGSLFERTTIIYSDFSDVKGLKTGAPVRLSGVQIGSVKDIHFKGAGVVRVAMSIKEDNLRLLTRDSTAAVNTIGLLGDKYVELSAGTDGRLSPGGVIAGTTPFDIQKLAGSGGAVIAKLEGVAGRLERILYLVENGNGSASKFIKDPSLYNNLNDSTKKLAEILDSINRGEGNAGRMVKDDSLYKNLDASSKKLNAILERLDKGEGALGGLTKDGRVSRELEQTIHDLKELVEDIKKNPKKYLKISIF